MEEEGKEQHTTIALEIRWRGKPLSVAASLDDTVLDLKGRLEVLTGVAPHAQKLIGLMSRGRQPPDHVSLSQLQVRNGQRCMLVGLEATRAAQLATDEEQHRAVLRAHAEAEAEQARQLALARQLQEDEEERMRAAAETRRLEENMNIEHRSPVAQQSERPFPREEEEEEQIGSMEINGLCAYSSAVAGNARLDFGDKVVLPGPVLEEAVRRGLSFPLTFKLCKRGAESAGAITHCGVLAFDAPSGMCYLPASVMNKLDLQEGDPLSLASVKLPKGEYIQLQPQSALWIDIPMNVREAILADQLRNYQTLTIGDTVTLLYGGKEYICNVIDVRPKPEVDEQSELFARCYGISIVDSDVAVDVIEPKEAYQPISNIELDSPTPVVGSLSIKDSATYRLRLYKTLDAELTIEVQVIGSGDVDLYVSNTSEIMRPGPLAHTWKAQNIGTKRLCLKTTDARLTKAIDEGWLYISVYAYDTPAEHPVRFSLECKQGSGHSLSQHLGHEGSNEDTDSTHCPNCHREIPTASYSLHEIACMRHNWRCDECGAVMPLADRDKHRTVAHVVTQCECGARLPPSEMQIHKEFECVYRLVPCLYCELRVPLEQRGEHQGLCGNRTVTCALCNATHKRNAIKKHVVEQHGIYPHHVTSDHYYIA